MTRANARQSERGRFCAPVRVPDEVYLVMRPHGGQTDYQTLLHELGHALHFAYTRADYPFEYRWVGDNSVTESYAMLFDHLMQHPRWLLRYSGLGKRELPPFLRAAALEELQFLRRYCAKLIYEVQLHGGQLSWDVIPDLYVETLTEATSFRYRRAERLYRCRLAVLRGSISPRVAARRAPRRIADRAVQRGLVPEPACGPVGGGEPVRRGAARAGGRSRPSRDGAAAVVRSGGRRGRAVIRVATSAILLQRRVTQLYRLADSSVPGANDIVDWC